MPAHPRQHTALRDRLVGASRAFPALSAEVRRQDDLWNTGKPLSLINVTPIGK